jgi:hypothetical protein
MNSTTDVAKKLFDLTIKLLVSENLYLNQWNQCTLQENDDYDLSCNRILTWSEQSVCYGHPSAHSLLATFYQFGLCGLQPNSTRVCFYMLLSRK